MSVLISVLIPVYNVEKYIEQCAVSLFKNTIADKCEFIFTNDCSSDNSIQVLNKVILQYPNLKHNIHIIHHNMNKGLATTRNTSFEKAIGKYIICTDSDDWVEPDYLEELLKKAEEMDADIVGCDYYKHIDNKKEYIQHYLQNTSKAVFLDYCHNKIDSYLWIKLIKRNFLLENNIKWKDGIDMWEDVLLFNTILSHNPRIAYINKALYHYRLRNNSYISNIINEKKFNNMIYVINTIDSIVLNTNDKELINAFSFKKFTIKNMMIFDGSKQIQRKSICLFPETYNFINYPNNECGFKRKFILKIHHHFPSFGLKILYFFTSLKKITNKKYKNYE